MEKELQSTSKKKGNTMKTTNSNNQKESKTMKEMKDNDQKAMNNQKETTNKAMKETEKTTEVKEMKDAKTIEQQLQELEDAKKALKAQLTEQKRAQRLEYQISDKVINLLERFAQTGLQLIENAKTIHDGTKDDNLANLSFALSKNLEGMRPLFEIFEIDLDELRGNVKPLSARGNKTDRTPREQRKLSDYGIKDGDRLIYAPTGDVYEVLDNGVIVDGKRYSLSTAVRVLKNNPGGSYSGFKFFRLPDHTESLIDTAVI